ncbi:hypothetical protein [Aliarcobacter butzleri]|uniref:hypothetical protein n=1 Tax=Aliarcobacter butzleri TaxID=28197 RepID=UPI0012FA7EC4|nr:hypothetical protein [Aliarcobacter butzleri]
MNEEIINESIKTPGFLKGFIYGVVSTITIILLILTPIIGFILKNFSFKEITTYIYEAGKNKETVEKDKEIFIELNNKIRILEEANNSYKIDNDILKEESNNIQKINVLIANYDKKYENISYDNSYQNYHKRTTENGRAIPLMSKFLKYLIILF